MTAALVLASGSPRRHDLLAQLGVPFDVIVSDVAEQRRDGEAPQVFAQRMAREKALAVAKRHPARCVLGADTIVVLDDAILTKPVDRADARRMLRALSGRWHHVLTAVALIDRAGGLDEILGESAVQFRVLEADEIETYLDTGEAYDKAGAYALQGLAKPFVIAVRGSRSNVIGLPLEEVAALLRQRVPEYAGDAA